MPNNRVFDAILMNKILPLPPMCSHGSDGILMECNFTIPYFIEQ